MWKNFDVILIKTLHVTQFLLQDLFNNPLYKEQVTSKMNDCGEQAKSHSPGIITIVYKHFLKAYTGDETSGDLILTCASNGSCFCSQ